jgi:hypothetical protein
MKKNDVNDELDELLRAIRPEFTPLQKVWLKVNPENPGMVMAVLSYPNRYEYLVRWADGEKDTHDGYELTDNRCWE